MSRNSKLLIVAFSAISAYGQSAINTSKLVDMTYDFDEKTIYWPTEKPLVYQREAGQTPKGYFYSAGRLTFAEHGGTHLDSPFHFAKNGTTTDKIPLSSLVGPAAVIDIRPACAKNPDYLLSVEDVTNWEKQHGRLADGIILLVHTGWGQYWPDKKKYLGTDKPGDTANLHFPGISKEAAEFLVKQRKLHGIGIDTASIDYGQSKEFTAHVIIYTANIYGLENVAHLEQLPATGATLIALPMKIKNGTGGPVRIVALKP